MKKEKLAAIVLVVIIVVALFAFLLGAYKDEIMDNLFKSKKSGISTYENIIESGDCVDINYIGRYTSNGTVFSSSYADVENRAGGTPIHVYVNLNKTALPPTNYSTYYSSPLMSATFEEYFNLYLSPLGVKEGFLEKLINYNIKDNKNLTTDNLFPEKAFGVSIKLNDILNLTNQYFGAPLEYKVLGIKENATTPSEFIGTYGNIGNKTTLYTLRENMHKKGDIIHKYLFWENSTVVTRIDETMLWMYTTPPYDVGVNFTWSDFNSSTYMQWVYPVNSSSVTSINESTIVITHTPAINSTIEKSYYYADYNMFYPIASYTVEKLTDDKINVSYVVDTATGNKSFTEFNRTVIIQRNQTQKITQDVPGEFLEIELMYSRHLKDDFTFSCNPLADKKVYFELEIVKLYKTSHES